MYIPRPFKMGQQEDCYELIEEWSFGDLITNFNGEIFVNHIPFVLDRENHKLFGHVARQNPQLDALASSDDLVVVFKAENSYISPSWYVSENMVPTWNYRVVQCRGKAELVDEQRLMDILELLSGRHEAQFESPWKIDKVAPHALEAMMRAIVGFEISLHSVEGKSKMSQNRSDEDKAGVIGGLEASGDVLSMMVAKTMLDL